MRNTKYFSKLFHEFLSEKWHKTAILKIDCKKTGKKSKNSYYVHTELIIIVYNSKCSQEKDIRARTTDY